MMTYTFFADDAQGIEKGVYYSNQRDTTISSQYLYFTAMLLYMFRAFSTPLIRSTTYCIHSHWYRAYILVSKES
jgi:hypothetical protein